MILSPFAWFWVGYISLGLFLLMEGIVFAWTTTEAHFIIKLIGTTIAVVGWPFAFISK